MQFESAQWYELDLEYPRFSIQPVQMPLLRGLRDAVQGRETRHTVDMTFAIEPLEDVPVISAGGGWLAFDSNGRKVLDSFARPGELRWIPLRLVTPDGVREDFAVAAPVDGSCDVISEEDTTFDGEGRPYFWYLDPAKVADRDVVLVPHTVSGFLAMRGRVIQALIDAGAQGVRPKPARVAPSQRRGSRRG